MSRPQTCAAERRRVYYVTSATGIPADAARRALEAAGWDVRQAIEAIRRAMVMR